ncbi:hypothetical protein DIPPA_20292 [Diplonema papillatum]|nr:hypothetical protein DIPPA_20292 [Diplonema papillatum]
MQAAVLLLFLLLVLCIHGAPAEEQPRDERSDRGSHIPPLRLSLNEGVEVEAADDEDDEDDEPMDIVVGHAQRPKVRRTVHGQQDGGLAAQRRLLYTGSKQQRRRCKPEVEFGPILADPGALVIFLMTYDILPRQVTCTCGRTLKTWILGGRDGACQKGWPYWHCVCRDKGVSGGTWVAETLRVLTPSPTPAKKSTARETTEKEQKECEKKANAARMKITCAQFSTKLWAFFTGAKDTTANTLFFNSKTNHASLSRCFTKIAKDDVRKTEAQFLPLGGPGRILELDEFSIGHQSRGTGKDREFCYLRYIGIVERGASFFVVRELPAKWQSLVKPGQTVELPSGMGNFTNPPSLKKLVIPPPPPISNAELRTILDEGIVELGTSEAPLMLTTDGAQAYRSLLDPLSPNFYWNDVEESKTKVRYAWVNHGKEEWTSKWTVWLLTDEFSREVHNHETDLLQAIHKGDLQGKHTESIKRNYVEKNFLAGTQKGDGTWGNLKKVIKERCATTATKYRALWLAEWKMIKGDKRDIFHEGLVAVGEAFERAAHERDVAKLKLRVQTLSAKTQRMTQKKRSYADLEEENRRLRAEIAVPGTPQSSVLTSFPLGGPDSRAVSAESVSSSFRVLAEIPLQAETQPTVVGDNVLELDETAKRAKAEIESLDKFIREVGLTGGERPATVSAPSVPQHEGSKTPKRKSGSWSVSLESCPPLTPRTEARWDDMFAARHHLETADSSVLLPDPANDSTAASSPHQEAEGPAPQVDPELRQWCSAPPL